MKNYLRKTDSTQSYTRVSLRKIITGCILFAIAVILQVAARNSTGFADWYVDTVYPFWVSTIGRLWSYMPFSVVEILLYILMAGLIMSAGRGMWRVLRRKRKIGDMLLSGAGTVILLIGSLFCIYTGMCGINYHATPFSERNEMEIRTCTVEELTAYCEMVTEEVNFLSDQVDREALQDLQKNRDAAVRSMENLGQMYEGLSGYYPNPKGILVSEILSYQHLTGVYSPFTIEANYNQDMIAYNIPFTMAHELSHLRGFMWEDEANYIAYLACSHSKDIEFRYSGTLMAWLYSTNLLYDYDAVAYEKLYGSLRPEVQKDLWENTKFWDKYEGAVSEVADKVNDTYLKANKQIDGVQSYDRMVDLLMAEYLSGEGK